MTYFQPLFSSNHTEICATLLWRDHGTDFLFSGQTKIRPDDPPIRVQTLKRAREKRDNTKLHLITQACNDKIENPQSMIWISKIKVYLKNYHSKKCNVFTYLKMQYFIFIIHIIKCKFNCLFSLTHGYHKIKNSRADQFFFNILS